MKIRNKKEKANRTLEDRTKIDKLKALLRIVLNLHFSNAITFQMIDKELFEKNFARFKDEKTITAISIFAQKEHIDKSIALMEDINLAQLLNITKKDAEEYIEKCKTKNG